MQLAVRTKLFRNSLWRITERKLPEPSPREIYLVNGLRLAFEQISASSEESCQNVGDFWTVQRSLLHALVAETDPRMFLRWKPIEATMCVGDYPYIKEELRQLKVQPCWRPRWQRLLEESTTGFPRPSVWYPACSGTTIHHAYHLCRFEEKTGLALDKMNVIVEFGGGYGNMCRLIHRLGFKGNYIIFDLPELCALQRFFLSMSNQPVLPKEADLRSPGIINVSELERFRSLIATASGSKMFIGTWSVSEAPVELRASILEAVSSFDAVLIAYQDRFGDVDNSSFFSNWRQKQAQLFESWDLKISHLPGNSYLIATNRSFTRVVTNSKKSPEPVDLAGRAGLSKGSPRMDIKKGIVDLSVIVVTYNRDAALVLTLQCLLNQDPAPREIIVVDQSREHNAATQRFLDEIIELQQIRYFFQPEPNAQRARNRAIAEALGEVILFVDDDVSMDEHLVGAHWENYNDLTLAAVCGFYTEPGEVPLEELPYGWDDSLTSWLYFPHCYTKRIESHLLATCNGSIRRELAVQLGGFDENYTYTHFDDTDFSVRLRKLGVKSVHDPEARLVHHKETSGGKRPGALNEYVIADSNRWYIWCYFFWMNFRCEAGHEIARRLRATVFRRANLTHPWYMVIAFWQFVKGALRAIVAIRAGRKLGFNDAPSSKTFDRMSHESTIHAD